MTVFNNAFLLLTPRRVVGAALALLILFTALAWAISGLPREVISTANFGRLLALPPLRTDPGPVDLTLLTAEGDLLLLALRPSVDGPVVMDLRRGESLLPPGFAGCHNANVLTLSSDERYLACWAAPTVELWDLEDGTVQDITTVSSLSALRFSPDGARLALLRHGDIEAGIHVWDVQRGERIAFLAEPGHVPRLQGPLSFSPDGRILAYVRSGAIHLWDISTDAEDVVPGIGPGAALAFDPALGLLVSGGGNGAFLLQGLYGGPDRLLPGVAAGRPNNITFSADGRLLIVGEADGVVRGWAIR